MSEPVVAVIGLGLIGGSVARDLHEHGLRVLGHDVDVQTLNAALQSCVVAQPLGDDLEQVRRADWLVLAVPVDATASVLERVRPHVERVQLITDVGSTKAPVMRAAAALGMGRRFVGSHPLAGDHDSGWQASRRGLFTQQRVYLCAGDAAEEGALRAARALWRLCGARTELIDAQQHDRLLARTSHLPQLLSSALAETLAAAGVPAAALGRGGRDMTRLAGSSPELWAGIALQNADELQLGLADLERSIVRLRELLATRDHSALHDFFAASRRWTMCPAAGRAQPLV